MTCRSSVLGAAALAFVTAGWAQNLPGEAKGILDETALARKAVAARDRAAATDHIRKATILAQDIQQHSPANTTPILVPVYREVDTSEIYSPVKHGDGDLTARRLKKKTTVRDAENQVTTGKLNVSTALDRLPAAQAAIEREDWPAADSALAATANGVVVTNTTDNVPLLKARQNLLLARARILEQKYADAQAPLREAARALADFENVAPGPHAEDAEYMRQQIEAYARDVAHNHEDALTRIDSWLDPVSQWNQVVTH